ncbi:MAG: hypothetical protein AAGG75_22760 [Bacteroidota bacterium]
MDPNIKNLSNTQILYIYNALATQNFAQTKVNLKVDRFNVRYDAARQNLWKLSQHSAEAQANINQLIIESEEAEEKNLAIAMDPKTKMVFINGMILGATMTNAMRNLQIKEAIEGEFLKLLENPTPAIKTQIGQLILETEVKRGPNSLPFAQEVIEKLQEVIKANNLFLSHRNNVTVKINITPSSEESD